MIRSRKITELKKIEDAVIRKASEYGRTIPEVRFFILDAEEFISLLEKNVYPCSPVNIWEGKNVIKRRFYNNIGAETGVYYEVVQCGNPSYAYLNENNSPTIQASVMAHVIGHCEFSEINVLKNSNSYRTEYVMHLTKRIENAVKNMGFHNYTTYWNCCESVIPLVNPDSQYSLECSVETEFNEVKQPSSEDIKKERQLFKGYSSTLDSILSPLNSTEIYKEDRENKDKKEAISRRGYKLKAPCQDVLGFLKNYAPASENERNILEYMYFVAKNYNFIMKTQIMNEGWSMYWEKKIMSDLFKEKIVKDVIDYCRVFSGVCNPRPFFMRNPYHMGYYMWTHIEDLYRKGKVSLSYTEEKNREKKEKWNKGGTDNPVSKMDHLVKTITDYEFIRRFLDKELMEKLYLNKIPMRMAIFYNILNNTEGEDIIDRVDGEYVYLTHKYVKEEMLNFFVDFNRPIIYIIDTDFQDGGLLLYHKYKGKDLKINWIPPTLGNINRIWKAPAYLITDNLLFRASEKDVIKTEIKSLDFDTIKEKMFNNEKPFKIE